MSKTVTLTDSAVAEVRFWLKGEIPKIEGFYDYLSIQSEEHPDDESYKRTKESLKKKVDDLNELLKQLEG